MAAAGDHVSNISHEEWLVMKAKSFLKTDIHAAKAWLITARTLFPRNFHLQFEAYIIEKGNKNVRHVGKILEDMLIQFPGEKRLWHEVSAMIEALQSESKDEKTIFLTDVFTSLPPTMQCHMLLQVAESTTDILAQTKLMLLVLKRHADQIQEHGIKLIEKLLTTEKQTKGLSAVNCYRKYLVYDVLPLVLKSKIPPAQHKNLICWLQKAIEFFICYMTQLPQNASDTPLSPPPDLASPTTPKSAGFSPLALSKWRMAIPGLNDKDSVIERPLQRLGEIVTLVGSHLDWSLEDFFSKNSEMQWQHIMETYDSVPQQNQSEHPLAKKLLYCTTVLCFTSLFNYSCGMMPSMFAATASGSTFPGAVLIEGLKSGQTVFTEHRSKKLKAAAEANSVHISASKNLHNSKDIHASFSMALKCWQLLQSTEILQSEFKQLLQQWKSDTWLWLKNFEIDTLIYQGQFKEACSKLVALKSTLQRPMKVETDLQTACCYYAMGNYAKTCESLLTVIQSLPPPVLAPTTTVAAGDNDPVPLTSNSLSTSSRQLHFLMCTEAEIMPYVINLLITCFKEKSLKVYAPDDMCLGHMLVLLQYDWPRYEPFLAEVVEKIKRQSSFTYNLFFNYVINIDILEEFAYLKTGSAGKISLDILPISTKAIAQSRTVTRGVNKGVKEDFKIHLEKQVNRSGENIDALIRSFLLEEKQLLQQNLM